MKYLYKSGTDRTHKRNDWKKSASAFAQNQTNFGELCGFADDSVNGGKGFGMHPHQNMKITTILVEGSQAHKDSTGGEGIISASSVQTTSEGAGIWHNEFNTSKTEPFQNYQIWVYPKTVNVKPQRETFVYQPEDKYNRILLALFPNKRKASGLINEDAFFSIAVSDNETSIEYKINLKGNGVYIDFVHDKISIDTYNLNEGDTLGIYETETIQINVIERAELIFAEVPIKRGIKI
jgi:quercetin 2,3-dioxygenase